MCGISGIVSHSGDEEEILVRLREMGGIQRHRGPDDRREMVVPTANGLMGFGFVRLSILDLETGMQPIICPEDRSAIICNGQIYNYIELRSELPDASFVTKGDVEVALHLYRGRGPQFLQSLNGMYAGGILDPLKEKLLLFRDRFGIKPLYYTTWNGDFLFSSEIKPLLAMSGRPRELNRKRLGTFFTYRYLPGEETLFEGIMCLPPGSYLEYDLKTDRYRTTRYWEYDLDRENPGLPLEEAAEKFHTIFTDAVRIRLRSDVEVGSLLSGGIDSSAVTSLVAGRYPEVQMFTVAFDEDPYNELPLVREFLGTNKERFGSALLRTGLCGRGSLERLPGIVRSLEDPISLGTVIPTDLVCRLAAEQVKVVLTGEGADEIFGGYRKFLIEMAAIEYSDSSRERQKELERLYPELASYLRVRESDPVKRYIQSELLFDREQLGRLLGRELPSDLLPRSALPNLSGNEHPLNAALAMESRFRLPDYVILRLDKLSMRHSLETRTPFLDYRLAEFAATLPVRFKVDPGLGQEKMICRYAFEKYRVLDRASVYREKQPFTIPLAAWLSDPGSLPDIIKEILLGDMVEKQGILNYKMVKDLTGRISATGVRPNTLVSTADQVFAAVIFTLWYGEFFSG